MEGQNERVGNTTEGGGAQPAITSRDETNPVGQDSPESEYGEIGGEAFILQQESGAEATDGRDFAPQGHGATEDEDEASSEGGVG